MGDKSTYWSMDRTLGDSKADSEDEDSFIVLENCSPSLSESSPNSLTNGDALPPIRTNKVHEIQNVLKKKISELNAPSDIQGNVDALEAIATTVARIAISPDSSYEEIQKQVEDLIKENETLKDIIAQNNLSMKTQTEKFLAYKDSVTNTVKSYKDKLMEAKTIIDKGKEENKKLASELEIYMNIKKLHEEEIINLKEKLLKEENPSIAVRTQEWVTVGDQKTQIVELQGEVEGANLKIMDLNAQLSQMSNLKEKIKDLEDAVFQFESKAKSLKCENDKLQEELKVLPDLETKILLKTEEIERLKEKLEKVPSLENQVHQKQEMVDILQFDISAMKKEVTKLRNENEELRRLLSEALTNNEKMQENLGPSKHSMELKNAEIANLKRNLEETNNREASLSRELLVLQEKYKDLKKLYDPNLEEDCIQLRSQLSLAQQTIIAFENEQAKHFKEVETLRRLLQETQAKDDEFFALKEQVNLFKNDYEAEKESKTEMKRQKDQIAEDLQNLQKRNQQLQNELEVLRARIQPKPEGYTCPKCSFGFNNYQSLENHVHRCLDLEGFP